VELYLNLFEDAVKKQAELVGLERALSQAKEAGLGISQKGHIVSCAGNPVIVLLRLIRMLTEDGNIEALEQCTTLMKVLEEIAEKLEFTDA